jgi:hypothetical protein
MMFIGAKIFEQISKDSHAGPKQIYNFFQLHLKRGNFVVFVFIQCNFPLRRSKSVQGIKYSRPYNLI